MQLRSFSRSSMKAGTLSAEAAAGEPFSHTSSLAWFTMGFQARTPIGTSPPHEPRTSLAFENLKDRTPREIFLGYPVAAARQERSGGQHATRLMGRDAA